MAIDLDAAPQDAPDAYLRLHLLSHRLVRPHGLDVDRHLRRADQRRVDRPRARARSTTSRRPGRGCARRGPVTVLRRRQVPADGRLRAADRRAHRRCRPGAARRAPGRRHDGHARGLRQLQRRHARHVDGRGPHQRRRRRRRRLRRRRRRIDHGHAVRWRHRGDPVGGAACSAPTPASASPSATTASSRPAAMSRPAPRSPCRTGRSSRPASSPAATT